MVLDKVVQILSEVMDIDESDLTGETEFVGENGIEPIDVAKIIILSEEKFNITVHDEYVSSFKKVEDIVLYIEKELNN